jgi:cytochrome bd ubiquinol oxidase subunit II
MDLPLFSGAFAALAIALYVMLDGFDLGVGALLITEPDESLRDQLIDSIMPMWDANETWLVMTGVILLAAFPVAYGILMPAFYLPLIIMLLSLGLRGVSFDFRFQAVGRSRRFWDVAFSLGSIAAASMQGLILGGLFQGVTITGHEFSGSVFDIFHPFPIVTAIAVLAGYVVLGGGWLHLKATAAVRTLAERRLRRATPIFVGLAMATCIAAALVQPGVKAAWAAHFASLITIAVLFFAVSIILMTAIGGQSDILPFLLALLQFALGIAGTVLVIFPDIVPFRLTVWDASSSRLSQVFLLTGAIVVTPVILAYSAFAYSVFRGKTPEKGWEG